IFTFLIDILPKIMYTFQQTSKISASPDSAPEEFLGATRTEIPLPVIGTGRARAELKISASPDSAPEEFLGATRTEMPLPFTGTGRACAELKIRKESKL
ncbi:MAG: hypothetical protein K2O03_12425, partial [Lachnospiraceae bacterium]|nr:hypothetical protein [Lachnospiraceae bacterium]